MFSSPEMREFVRRAYATRERRGKNYYALMRDMLDCNYCSVCDRPAEFVHHKDGDNKNNSRSNLMYVCKSCHRFLHGAFEFGRRAERLST